MRNMSQNSPPPLSETSGQSFSDTEAGSLPGSSTSANPDFEHSSISSSRSNSPLSICDHSSPSSVPYCDATSLVTSTTSSSKQPSSKRSFGSISYLSSSSLSKAEESVASKSPNSDLIFRHHSQNIPFPVFQSAIMSKIGSLSSPEFSHCVRDPRLASVHVNFNHSAVFECKSRIRNLESSDSSERKKSMERVNQKKLSFGIDRILFDENSRPTSPECNDSSQVSKPDTESHNHNNNNKSESFAVVGSEMKKDDGLDSGHHPNNNCFFPSNHDCMASHLLDHPHALNNSSSNVGSSNCTPTSANPLNLTRCPAAAAAECYYLGNRYCRNNGNLQHPLLVNSSTTGGPGNAIPASFSPWIASTSLYESPAMLSPSGYHGATLPPGYAMGPAAFSTMSSLVACTAGSGARRKRSWSRAVFSSLQRKGLEKRFQIQKYITKPDRRQLAATLGLTDAQVKVWFQNRRMKWRHSKEGKVTSGISEVISMSNSAGSSNVPSVSSNNRDGGKSK